ncbi:MAG: hypothetical protein R3332_10065 [Pseudohongiellaceae bacterium]|nr:hypothetical protein [Pseudohongiellaceae bacterium]
MSVFSKLAMTFLLYLLCYGAVAQETIVIAGVVYRDPLQPAGASRISPEQGRVGQVSYSVSFIRTGGEVDVAVVNGQTVAEGDTVDGALVKEIDKDTVTLDVDGESIDISTFRATFRTLVPQN